ncbi:hypothetical protein QLL95_gp1031 [Cotonvirus japonicus]|uniref:Uncharacterized protein n=1 Tax=Cotonvirus japonicus TaxID=2811091 RepID=A0ABM7NSF6_9VIRU|nr:hypothetical protein QLL95_gp1031 [Cotonvirus japonicus]BCS83092.1 hypothetical protein [Cotonvirus japonicus]
MKNNNKSKLKTDKDTDYMFSYFMHEPKINPKKLDRLDEELEKKLVNHDFNLDSRVMTDKHKHNKSKNDEIYSTSEETELPSDSDNSVNVDFHSDSSNSQSESSTDSDFRSPYKNKISAIPPINYKKQLQNNNQSNHIPLLGDNLIENVEKYIETPEEKRARARDAYAQLQELVEEHGVELNKKYSIDDDPDELEAEYKMQRDKRNKKNKVKFYKGVLINIISGVELLNEKYDPFAIKLKDWSKQVASDMDDYTEVLGEIYEKYKHIGGNMAPEIKLIFMIIMSGVTFHISQQMFGSGGLTDTLDKNPNVIGKLLGGLMNGGGIGKMLGGDAEPSEAKPVSMTTKKLMESIKKHNNKKISEVKSETVSPSIDNHSDTFRKIKEANDAVAAERQKRLLAEQKADYEAQLRRRDEIHANQLEQMINQQQNLQAKLTETLASDTMNNFSDRKNNSVNLVLSDINQKPRFMQNKLSSPVKSNDNYDIFASEKKTNNKKSNKNIDEINFNNFDDIVESIGSNPSTVSELDDLFISEKKKPGSTRSKINSITKSASRSVSKKVPNSITQSVSKKRNSNTSDSRSTTKKGNIIDLDT